MAKLGKKTFTKNAKIGLSLLVVAVVAIASVVAAALVLPKVAPDAEPPVTDIAAIVADNEGIISVDADLSKVFATIKYKDGSERKVALSELIVTGLDTSDPGSLDNVILDYGGFKQAIKYEVVPTLLEIEYVASTGGRIEGDSYQQVPAGLDASRVQAIADEGYIFVNWSDGNPNASRLDRQVASSQRIIAVFEKRRYAVVFFYPDGTTAREEIVAYNEAPTRIPRASETNMRLYGYRFVGFDKDFSKISDNTDIYPLFEKYATDTYLEYTLDAEGVPLGTSDAIPFYEKDIVATIRVLANPDRLFTGWSIKTIDGIWIDLLPEGEQRLIKVAVDHNIQFRTSQTGTSEEYALNFTPHVEVEELYIKAHFVYLESEISFTSMSVKAKEPFTIAYNEPIGDYFDVEDLTYLQMLGYEFKGWAIKNGELDEFGKPVIIENSQKFSQPTELVAQWEKKVYDVVFLPGNNENPDFTSEANGYDPTIGGRVLRAYYQDSLAGAIEGAFPEEPVYYTNHTFKGWFVRGNDMLPTDKSVDKTYKIDREITYVVPVFEVNKVDLVANILEGAGTIVNLVADPENPELPYTEVEIRGIFKMAVNEDYKFRVKAASGYRLVQVKIGDVTIDMPPDQGDYDFTISSPLQAKYVSARFRMAQYNINVSNGSAGTEGTIVYNDVDESETGYVQSESQTVSLLANYGSNKNIEITAQDGYYIMSVVSDGVSLSVPYLATYYSVRLSSINKNLTIAVTYRDFRYNVQIQEAEDFSDGQDGFIGEVSLLDSLSGETTKDYSKNSNPRIGIEASSEYYIKAVKVNGWTIDPYQPITGFLTSSIKVLNEDYQIGDPLDPRVTYLVLTVSAIKADASIEVVFERLYFNITISSEGNGVADDSKTTLYDTNVDIKAETTAGYYISAVEIDGVQQNLVGLRTSIVHTLVGVTKDFQVRFVFTAKRLAVSYKPSEGASVVYKNLNYSLSLGKTFTGLYSGSNNTFIIQAREGDQIDSIEYYSSTNPALIINENISFNAITHTLQLDNLSSDYYVTVRTKPLYVSYTLHTTNKKGSVLRLNGADMGVESTYESSLIHGSNLTVEIETDTGLSVEIDDIFIKNKDTRQTYTYQRTAELNEGIAEGQYFMYEVSFIPNLIIAKVNTDIDIFITLTDLFPSYDINLETIGSGDFTASATIGGLYTEIDSSTEVPIGTEVTYVMAPDSGYMLSALIMNGTRISSGITNNQYVSTMGASAIYASAIFVRNRFSVTVDSSDPNGTVTTASAIFSEGSTFDINASARKGYTVKTFSISVGNPPVIYPIQVQAGQQIFDYSVPSEYTVDNITVKATFEPNGYKLTISKTGNGTLSQETINKDVKYGDSLALSIDADDFHYIESILINGISYSPWDLTERLANYEINQVESGNISMQITQNTTILVNFLPNEYRISLIENINGETLFKKVSSIGVSSQFMTASEIRLNSGDTLWLKMMSNEGYHIGALTVNGVENNAFRVGNTRDNDLTEIFLQLLVVSSHVRIEVNYDVNIYSMKLNASNTSVNYKDFDKTPQDYGRVTVVGFLPNLDNEYTGFAHGSNIRIFIQPRTARGYYIDKFAIKFSDGTELLIGDADMPRNGGSYTIYNLTSDIDELTVEFRRRLFTFSLSHNINQLGSPFGWVGNVQSVFTNPYSRDALIVLVDGTYYEYGTTFEMYLFPGNGYSRTVFNFNGEDRRTYVRSNKYTGVVTSNIVAEAEFQIDTFEITSEQNYGGTVRMRDESNNLIWSPGIQILQPGDPQPQSGEFVSAEVTNTRGHIWVYSDRIVATYNTLIKFIATPNNASNGISTEGYRVSSFSVNGTSISVSGDLPAFTERTVTGVIGARSVFSVNRYALEIAQFEGGNASASPAEVIWDNPSTISITLEKGYYISSVKINGAENNDIRTALSANSLYTMVNIRETKNIAITLERKRYDIVFDTTGDYKKTFSINNGERELNAVSWAALNEGVPRKTAKYFRSDDGTILENGYIKTTDNLGAYIGLRYADKLVFHLVIPNGFTIDSISIKMDDEGNFETEILNQEAGLDADDGTGKRTYTIGSVTGNVEIYVKYKIKTYAITYVLPTNGEFTDMSKTTVAHHEKVTWNMQADYGYYLSRLEINGISYSVESSTMSYEKVNTVDGTVYRYNTDVLNFQSEVIQKEISDALLNGNKTVRIVPFFAPLYFSIVIQINNRLTNDNLSVSISNNRVMYDPVLRATFNHVLTEGYSITGIEFWNFDGFGNEKYILNENLDGTLSDGEFNPKDSSLSLPTSGQLIDIMDFHSSYKKIIRAYYLVAQDIHTCDFSFHLIESELDNSGVNYINKGNSFTDDGMIPRIGLTPAFGTSRDFTDNISPEAPHAYGVYGLYNSSIDPTAQSKYEFSGYQEKVNGVWAYVTNATPNIELLSNGKTMRVNVKSDREFRAVFFRLYKVSVEVHPEFKYVQGSFATSEPDLMNYRLYSSVYASAQHFADPLNAVVLPNIPNTYVDLFDVSTENLDGKYEFLIRSGATLSLRTIDRSPTVNPSRSYVYYDIEKTEYSYNQGSGFVEYDKGISILKDKLVYSYARNNVYLSFAIQTEGAVQSNAGGTITYLVNGNTSSLVNNSLIIAPDSTVEVTIKPNSNYRFESISSLGYMPRGSEDGYRRSTGVFTPLQTTNNGQIVVTYYDISNNPVIPGIYTGRIATVKVLMKNVSENAIFSVKFWKQIEYTKKITIMTDEGFSTNLVNKRPNFIDSSEDGTYDFGDYINLKLNIPTPLYTGWDIRWQFVGFFVNGINLFKGLSTSYPTQTQVTIRLDNSAYIVDKLVDNKTVFAVDVVARFIPVYNVVIENEYKYDPADSPTDIYLNPQYLTWETIPHRVESMRYTRETGLIYPKSDANNLNDDPVKPSAAYLKVMGKVNTLDGVKESPLSGYNTWKNNNITLNWTGAALAGPTYKFLGWQYYKYDSFSHTFAWASIPYVEVLGGTQGTMDYKRPSYTFPLSSIISSSYYTLFNTEGFVNDPGALTSIWKYNTGLGAWEETINVPAIRIRPLFQKVVPAEIIKEVATETENQFEQNTAAGIRPIILENSLPSASFEYYKTIVMDPAIRTGYEFKGWYYKVDEAYIPLTNTDPLSLKQVGATSTYLSYKYTTTNKRLDIRLDSLNQDLTINDNMLYKIVARYVRIFNITIEVVSASGTSPYLTNALPNVAFYGPATRVGEVWSDPVTVLLTQRKVTYTSYVGNRLVFKLLTGYDPAKPNDWSKYNERFDKLYRIEDLEINYSTDMWATGDSLLSTGVVLGSSAPSEIENATYRIAANGDKYIKIFFRTEADLIIHNLYYNSFVRIPDALAIAKEWKSAGSTEKIYIQDNGLRDQDPAQGIIRINDIPVQPGVNYDGVVAGDYGNRISANLSPNAILSSQIYQRSISLNGNSITSKLAQFSYYMNKADVLVGYQSDGVTEIRQTLTSPLVEYPFDAADTVNAGDGSSAKPFLIATLRQLQNVDALYNGNVIGGVPTLRYLDTSGGVSVTRGLNFKVVANIDLNQETLKLTNPICSSGNGFDGIFEGNNQVLYNIKPTAGGDYRGLFARLHNGAEVKNLKVGNFNISGGSAQYVGLIAGLAGENTIITNISTDDTVAYNPDQGRSASGMKYVGGIAGYLTKGAKVMNCTLSDVQIQGQYEGYITDIATIANFRPGGAGGIVGVIGDEMSLTGLRSSVSGCTIDGVTVIGKYAQGGIAGAILSAQTSDTTPSLSSSYVIDPLFAESEAVAYIGGVVGFLGLNRQVSNCSMSANDIDVSIFSKWSSTAYTLPQEPTCLQYGGGGIAGINLGRLDNVIVNGTRTIYLYGSVSGGIVGINGGELIKSETYGVAFRTDRKKIGNAWRSGTFGVHVGYNRANGTILGATTDFYPANFTTNFAEGSAVYTMYTEVAQSWADVFNIETYIKSGDPTTIAVSGDDPGDDTSNLYLGGFVGYNRGTIASYYVDEILDTALNFRGKLLVSRRSGARAVNNSYIGLAVGYNDTATNILDTDSVMNGRLDYYRYCFVGYKGFNLAEPYSYTYDYLGGLIGFKQGTGLAITPGSNTSIGYVRYEANGNGSSDHDPVSGGFWGQESATNFPISRIDLTNDGFTSAITTDNPISFTLNLDNEKGNNYLSEYIDNLATWPDNAYEYYGKYRQTIVS